MRQPNLFQELIDEIKNDSINFSFSTKKTVEDLEETISNLYSKDQLASMSLQLCRAYMRQDFVFKPVRSQKAQGFRVEADKVRKTSNSKAFFANFWAYIFSVPDNITAIYKALPEWQRRVAQQLLLKNFMTPEELLDAIDKAVRETQGKRILGDTPLFCIAVDDIYNNYFSGGVSHYRFPSAIFDIINQAIMPDVMKQKEATNQLPDDMSHMAIVSFEKDVPDELALLKVSLKNIFLNYRGMDRMLSVRSKIQRMKLKEYDPKVMGTFNFEDFRKQAILQSISTEDSCLIEDLEIDPDAPTQITMNGTATSHIKELQGQWIQFLLPNINVKNYNYSDDFERNVIAQVLEFVDQSTVDQWYSVDFLRTYLVAKQTSRGFRLGANEYGKPLYLKFYNKLTKCKGFVSDISENISLPLGYGFIYFLNSLGFVDIMVDTQTTPVLSPYDNLRYFRLNKLGQLAFGHISQYECDHEVKTKKYLSFDPQHLIIKSEADPNPFLDELLPISNDIGGGRYQVTMASFLKNCSYESDVDYNIRKIKILMGKKIPKIWSDFFEELKQKIKPMTALSLYDYELYQIDPDNKAMLRLLTTEPSIRDLIIKAEGYRILIPKRNLRVFKNRLKKYGYIL